MKENIAKQTGRAPREAPPPESKHATRAEDTLDATLNAEEHFGKPLPEFNPLSNGRYDVRGIATPPLGVVTMNRKVSMTPVLGAAMRRSAGGRRKLGGFKPPRRVDSADSGLGLGSATNGMNAVRVARGSAVYSAANILPPSAPLTGGTGVNFESTHWLSSAPPVTMKTKTSSER